MYYEWSDQLLMKPEWEYEITIKAKPISRPYPYFGPCPPLYPSFPPYSERETVCPKCGMVWKGAMMYWCPNNGCPVQPHVTC